VISSAAVLAWSAIPLGAIAGAWLIEATDDVGAVYVGIGMATTAIALAFAVSPIRDGDRYLEEARLAKAANAAAEPEPAGATD
jgi:hypothetical protein